MGAVEIKYEVTFDMCFTFRIIPLNLVISFLCFSASSAGVLFPRRFPQIITPFFLQDYKG